MGDGALISWAGRRYSSTPSRRRASFAGALTRSTGSKVVATGRSAAVALVDVAPVTADDMRVPAGSDVVVPTPLLVVVDVEIVERIGLGGLGQFSLGLIGPVNGESVEGEPDDRGVLVAFVTPGCLNADGILVIMVGGCGGWVSTASVHSPNSIGLVDVVERVEEDDAVDCEADWPGRECAVGVFLVHGLVTLVFTGFQWDVPGVVLLLDPVGVAVDGTVDIGEDGGRVVGQVP